MANLLQPSLGGNNLDLPSTTKSQQKLLEVGKMWQVPSGLAPGNSVKASWALGGWDNWESEPFGASIWKLPNTESLGLCIFYKILFLLCNIV